jgi:hypothetical protein
MGWSIFDRGPIEPRWRNPQSTAIIGNLCGSQIDDVIRELKTAAHDLHLEQIEKLHYLRIFALGEDRDLDGHPLAARLVLSAVFEGGWLEFMRELVKVGSDRLKQILRYCEAFPTDGDHNDVYEWLLQHREEPQAYHVGTLWDDLQHIKDEYRLWVTIGKHIDEQRAAGTWGSRDPVAIRRKIQEFVRTQDSLPQAPRPAVPWRLRFWEALDLLKMLAILAVLPALLACLSVWICGWNWWHLLWQIPVIGLLLAGAYLLVVLCYELLEGDLVIKPAAGAVAALVAEEDFGIQNQLTLAIAVRNSRFRRLTIRIVLWLANAASKHWYRRGQLVGVDTIHFARFHLIDEGRRMLFMSEFDGGWERYLFDFLGVGSLAVVPIWTNLHGCPKTRFLRFVTKGFAQRFLPFTRAQQQHTHLWYCTVDYLTVAEIKRNAAVRAGLFGSSSRQAAEEWLKLL